MFPYTPTTAPLLPAGVALSLSQLLAVADPQACPPSLPCQAEQQWEIALAALNELLTPLAAAASAPGFILTGPVPILTHLPLMKQAWVFSQPWGTCRLLPATADPETITTSPAHSIPLLPTDPLALEQFCLVLTPHFSLVLVRATPHCQPADFAPLGLQFSFDPAVIEQSYQSLRWRLGLTRPDLVPELDAQLLAYPSVSPDYHLVSQFGRLLLHQATQPQASQPQTHSVTLPNMQGELLSFVDLPPTLAESIAPPPPEQTDLELLQAIAHEVRTPLATIKTLTQLLLRRIDLPPEVTQRLEAIYRECAEQIDRFSLIFRAAELETETYSVPPPAMASVCLSQVFAEGIPRWQKQASQHNLTLEVLLPPKLPAVKSDPTLLDQVLTGLIAQVTHRLPCGSHIQVKVTPAGNQLKLQVFAPPTEADPEHRLEFAPLKSVGQLLMVQPETGKLSLSLPVTKNLFQVLGGKLTVRQRPHQEEIFTLFLPLGAEGDSGESESGEF